MLAECIVVNIVQTGKTTDFGQIWGNGQNFRLRRLHGGGVKISNTNETSSCGKIRTPKSVLEASEGQNSSNSGRFGVRFDRKEGF